MLYIYIYILYTHKYTYIHTSQMTGITTYTPKTVGDINEHFADKPACICAYLLSFAPTSLSEILLLNITIRIAGTC